MPASVRSSTVPRHVYASKASSVSEAPSIVANSYLPVIITTSDLKQSLSCFETLLSTAKAYRNAMLTLASATSAFACALEDCARQKGSMSESADKTYQESDGQTPQLAQEASPGEKLMAAAGLHHLLGNHGQILSDSFYRHFEVPLMQEYDEHRRVVADRQAAYEKSTAAKAKVIRETESRNIKMGRKKQRDLASFRKALNELQQHVNDLDNLKIEHYSEVYDNEQDMWEMISNKTSVVVRSEIEMYDKVVGKGSADPILDAMGQTHPDPFNAYARKEDVGQLFSILPPLSMLTPSQSIARTAMTPSSSAPGTPSRKQDADYDDNTVTPVSQTPSTARHARNLSNIAEGADGSVNDGFERADDTLKADTEVADPNCDPATF